MTLLVNNQRYSSAQSQSVQKCVTLIFFTTEKSSSFNAHHNESFLHLVANGESKAFKINFAIYSKGQFCQTIRTR